MRSITVVLLALVLGACGSTPATLDSSPRATLSPSGATEDPTASPSVTPTEAPSATPGPAPAFAHDSLVEVIVTDLIVRTAPGVDPTTSSILPDGLTSANRAFIADGPVSASGYDWYLAAPLDRPDGSRGPFGWIAAASREGERWISEVAAPCPATVDLAAVLGLQPLERLACFGDEPLTLNAASIGCGAGGGPWTWDPGWLVMVGGCGLSPDASGEDVLLYRVRPGDSEPSAGPVLGHFDDAAAAGCSVTSADPAIPAPSREEAVVICRTQFVIGAP